LLELLDSIASFRRPMDLESSCLHSCRRDMSDRAVVEEGLLATSSALLVPLEGSYVVIITFVLVTLVSSDGYEWVVLYSGGSCRDDTC
jgi:hypothetical protein